MKISVAAIQLNSTKIPDKNIEDACHYIEKAAEQGAQLVALPEMWLCMGDERSMSSSDRFESSKYALQLLCGLAKRHQLWIVAGSMAWYPSVGSGDLKIDQKKPYSRCFIIDDQGDIQNHYDKLHLFDAKVDGEKRGYRESESYNRGDRVVVEDTPVGVLGLAICYDLRFPELFRCMWQMGANLFIVPSAFTYKTGKAHWITLLKARAIENSCFVIAPNQCGVHDAGRKTWGHSAIINPWGEELAVADSDEANLLMATIDLNLCTDLRKKMPSDQHQRIPVSSNLV